MISFLPTWWFLLEVCVVVNDILYFLSDYVAQTGNDDPEWTAPSNGEKADVLALQSAW